MKKGKRIAGRDAAAASHTVPNRAKKSKKSKKNPWIKFLIVLGGIAAVAVAAVLIVEYGFRPDITTLPPPDFSDPDTSNSPGDPNTSDDPNDPGNSTAAPSVPPRTELPVSELDKDIRIVLVVGCYDGTNTDTIMVAALNYKKKTIEVMSIPRDTVISYDGKRTRINAIHVYTEKKKKGEGMNGLAYELSKILGFMPNEAVFVRYKGFIKTVDAVGGIQFNVPQRLYKPSENIDLQPGDQLLNGDKALMLMRYRGYSGKTDIPGNDFGRMYMQQQFLKEAAKQIITPKNIGKVNEFAEIINENVTTTMSLTDLIWYAQEVMGINPDNINFHTLPTVSVEKAYEYVVTDEALALINATINPYKTPITRDMLELAYEKEAS